jgi:hypothetical protein
VKIKKILQIKEIHVFIRMVKYNDITLDDLVKDGIYNNKGCLLWTKLKDTLGYGRKKIDGKTKYVHRTAMEKFLNRKLDTKEFVRHGPFCRTSCFNIEHLKIGTNKQNMFDDRLEAGTLPRGENNSSSFGVTDDLARQIKWSFLNRDHLDFKTKQKRAEYFGVGIQFIRNIDGNRTYNFIPDINGFPFDTIEINKKKANARILAVKQKNEFYNWEFAKLQIKKRMEILEFYKDDNTNCLLSKNYVNKRYSYPTLSIKNLELPIHVWIYAIKIKRFLIKEENKIIFRTCSNSRCCNIEHITSGTRNEKGIIDRNNKKNGIKEKDVIEIRIYYKDKIIEINKIKMNMLSVKKGIVMEKKERGKIQRMIKNLKLELALKYNVHINTIMNIIEKRTFKDV